MNPALQITFGAVIVIFSIVGFVWVARDASERGRSPIIWSLLCLLMWPLGFLIWRIVRPPTVVTASH
jgi:hypothetical protein